MLASRRCRWPGALWCRHLCRAHTCRGNVQASTCVPLIFNQPTIHYVQHAVGRGDVGQHHPSLPHYRLTCRHTQAAGSAQAAGRVPGGVAAKDVAALPAGRCHPLPSLSNNSQQPRPAQLARLPPAWVRTARLLPSAAVRLPAAIICVRHAMVEGAGAPSACSATHLLKGIVECVTIAPGQHRGMPNSAAGIGARQAPTGRAAATRTAFRPPIRFSRQRTNASSRESISHGHAPHPPRLPAPQQGESSHGHRLRQACPLPSPPEPETSAGG